MGSGFVLDDRHVMTCAHVVGDCLGGREKLRDSTTAPEATITFDMPMAPQYAVRASPVPDRWHPERSRNTPAEAAMIDDVAVLRLLDGEVLPSGAQPVFAANRFGAMEQVFAFGTDPDLRDGSHVLGHMVEQVALRRLKLMAQAPGIRPGCSGAAVWNMTEGGISGMIAERSADGNGLVIPISTLMEVWPDLAPRTRRTVMQATPRPPRQRRLLRDELAERLCQFDRIAQASEFETFAIEKFDETKRPLLCVIAGLDRDAPRLCRDKCRQKSLHRRLSDLGIRSDLVDARRLPWPVGRRFNSDIEFKRLRNMLGDELGSRGSPDAMRSAYVGTGRPLVLFSELDQGEWSESHRKLLRDWGALWSELGAEPSSLPLVHFLLVRLDERRVDAEEPKTAYAKHKRFANGVSDAIGSIAKVLPPLEHIIVDEVESWIDGLSDQVDASEQDITRARQGARRVLGALRYPRLADLETWIERLRI